MDGSRRPRDEYSHLMQFAAQLSRLVGVTTSVFAVVAAAIALVAIVVALVLSL